MININTAIRIKIVLKCLIDEKSSFKALNPLSILSYFVPPFSTCFRAFNIVLQNVERKFFRKILSETQT